MSGIVGVVLNQDDSVANLLLYGLYALQHRGQANSGMATINHNRIMIKKGTGQINEVFQRDLSDDLPGSRGLGHVKCGDYRKFEIDEYSVPQEFSHKGIDCLMVIDGVFTNKNHSLKTMAEKLMGKTINSKDYLKELSGAFAGIYLDRFKMVAFRDPLGLKPICIGKLDDGYIIASETCAIDSCKGTLIRMLKPGEVVIVKNNELEFFSYIDNPKSRACLFEYVYISRPDSYLNNISIYNTRHTMGKILYDEHKTKGDIVMGAPDSGLISAIGYAEASGIPYKDGIIKNRYIGRTFINPDDSLRTKDLFIKLNPIKEVLKNQRVILVDDSIVRGSTVKRTIKMLKEAGAKEVHVRIASPMVIKGCDLSYNIPDEESLIAHHMDLETIKNYIGADSLYFLSIKGLKKACGNIKCCDYCFSGNHPIREEK